MNDRNIIQNDFDLSSSTGGQGAASLIECPRDAMQGWKHFIPTEKKVEYINALLQVGFDTIDFGSFVSPKAIPQMADTKEVVKKLQVQSSRSKLLAIVANLRGAEEAMVYDEISYLGFPFSLSPTFQRRNTNSTMEESFETVKRMQELCISHDKQLVVYLSMGFGNPYGDAYDDSVLLQWAGNMAQLQIPILSLADTVGLATPQQISDALKTIIPQYPHITIGVHLHSTAANWKEKIAAAYTAGCRRFDGALKGIGGCPMANDELIGNMATEWIIDYCREKDILPSLNEAALQHCLQLANEIFV